MWLWIAVKQGPPAPTHTKTFHFSSYFSLQDIFLFKLRTFFLSPLSSRGLWFGVCMVIKSLMRPLETAVWGKQMASSRNLSVSFISLHFVCIHPSSPTLICSSFRYETTIHITLRKKENERKKNQIWIIPWKPFCWRINRECMRRIWVELCWILDSRAEEKGRLEPLAGGKLKA